MNHISNLISLSTHLPEEGSGTGNHHNPISIGKAFFIPCKRKKYCIFCLGRDHRPVNEYIAVWYGSTTPNQPHIKGGLSGSPVRRGPTGWCTAGCACRRIFERLVLPHHWTLRIPLKRTVSSTGPSAPTSGTLCRVVCEARCAVEEDLGWYHVQNTYGLNIWQKRTPRSHTCWYFDVFFRIQCTLGIDCRPQPSPSTCFAVPKNFRHDCLPGDALLKAHCKFQQWTEFNCWRSFAHILVPGVYLGGATSYVEADNGIGWFRLRWLQAIHILEQYVWRS